MYIHTYMHTYIHTFSFNGDECICTIACMDAPPPPHACMHQSINQSVNAPGVYLLALQSEVVLDHCPRTSVLNS